MKKIIFVLFVGIGMLFGSFGGQWCAASVVVDFEGVDTPYALPYEVEGVSFVPWSMGMGSILQEEDNKFLRSYFWMDVYNPDGFTLFGFDGRSASGEMQIMSYNGGEWTFLVGTSELEPAIFPDNWDPQYLHGTLLFLTQGDLDNLRFGPPVPVPAAAWLLGAGLTSIAAYRRKRG